MDTAGISRRDFTQAGIAVGALAMSGVGANAQQTNPRPNILFITMDELRWDASGSAGNAHIATPNIDALAARGTTFARTYCQGPLCQPARASIITGQYVKQHGQTFNGFDMKPSWPTLMKALQAAGYTTSMVGKTHFSGSMRQVPRSPSGMIDLRAMTPWCQEFGLDYLVEEFDHTIHKSPRVITPYLEYLNGKGLLDQYRAEIRTAATSTKADPYWGGHVSTMGDDDQLSAFISNQAIEWLQGNKQSKPFFLWVSFVAPHPPITMASQWFDRYKDADIPTGTRQLPDMPDNPWGRYLRQWVTESKSADMSDADALQMARHYYALVSQVDYRIGDILKTLDEHGQGKDTWIIFSADHGEMLGHHNLVYKNVFFKGSVQVPNIIVPPGGTAAGRVDGPVESVDLTATMLDVAGAALPTSQGRSLVPMLNGGAATPREVVYSELAGLNNMGNYFVMAATDRYRYMYDKLNQLPCELYDLRNDPDEMHNLVADSGYQNIRDELHKNYVLPFINA